MFAGLQPRVLLALRTSIKHNAHFITDNEVLYPAGAVLLLHNYQLKNQRYIPLMEKSIYLDMIIISPSRTMAAIIINDEKGQIVIYDLKTLKKKKVLNLPHDAYTKRFEYMCFSHDEKLLLTLTGDPDWMMLAYNWEKGKVETFTRANYINNPGPVSQVLCSPTDSAVCCLLGPGLFRLMNMQETVWRQYGFQKADQLNVITAAFIGSDRLLLGTSDGRLILIDNGELKGVYDACTVNIIAIVEKEEGTNTQPVMIPKAQPQKEGTEDRIVRAMTSFNKGFAYSCGSGRVHMFEKEELKNSYRRRNLFVVLDPDFREDQTIPLNIVQHMSISPTQNTLLATTNRSQIYSVTLWGPDISLSPEVSFKHLGESLHHGPISGLSMCTWKPIFMTCGATDRTVRLWNYETGELEMLKQYEEDVLSVALHPTALFAAIGFTDKLRYMIVLLDDIQLCRTFPISECRLSVFSCNGHYLAAINKMSIIIYSTISFTVVATFKGHNGKITSLVWTPDDKKLVSCGEEGAVYEWDLATQTRVGETVDKSVAYWECAVSGDSRFVYAVGNDGKLKEMSNSNVLRMFNFGQKDLPHIVISRSDQMMFLCGDSGLILSVKVPLIEPIDRKPFLFHNSKILKMKLTYDDKTLVTVSETGSLCIWSITEGQGRTINIDKHFAYCTDVLIPKVDLQEKVAKIKELSKRMEELIMEEEYRIKQAESTYNSALQQIHNTYGEEIEEIMQKMDVMERHYKIQVEHLTSEIAALQETNEATKQNLESTYNAQLIVEYKKFDKAQEEQVEMAEEYERKIANIIASNNVVLEECKNVYEKKIELLEADIAELERQKNLEKMEHEVMKQQIEEDVDREIVELKESYEKLLLEEREFNVEIKGEAGVLKKKLDTAQKENIKNKVHIAQLQNEQEKAQKDINTLNHDISELKREIYERDLTIQDKEKRIYDMKKNNEELEKYKFVLTHKINELNIQLEPKELQLEQKEKQIAEMENEMELMQMENGNLEVAITEYKKKLMASDHEVRKYKDKSGVLTNQLTQVAIDIVKVSFHIQDFKKLKDGVKRINDKFGKGDSILKKVQAQSDLECELMKQREYLESIVRKLQMALKKKNKKDDSKTIKENVVLIEEVNFLRKTIQANEEKLAFYENFLLTSPGKIVSKREAQKRFENFIKSQDEGQRDIISQIDKAEQETLLLKEELERVKNENQS